MSSIANTRSKMESDKLNDFRVESNSSLPLYVERTYVSSRKFRLPDGALLSAPPSPSPSREESGGWKGELELINLS